MFAHLSKIKFFTKRDLNLGPLQVRICEIFESITTYLYKYGTRELKWCLWNNERTFRFTGRSQKMSPKKKVKK